MSQTNKQIKANSKAVSHPTNRLLIALPVNYFELVISRLS